jgi:hypothetical protein
MGFGRRRAGAEKEIRLAYRMKWPADRSIVFETLPTPDTLNTHENRNSELEPCLNRQS